MAINKLGKIFVLLKIAIVIGILGDMVLSEFIRLTTSVLQLLFALFQA